MGKEKKDEPMDGEQEQVGPYVVDEQVAQREDSAGELYRATHETRGTTALVYKPGTEETEGPERPRDWEVLCVSSVSPRYLAVEVKHTSVARKPEKPATEELLDTFERVAEGVERMARSRDDSEPLDTLEPAAAEPPMRSPDGGGARLPWRWLCLAVAGVAMVCALAWAWVGLSPPGGDAVARAAPVCSQEPGEDVEADTLTGGYEDLLPPELRGIAKPLPFAPLKGQKRPPCTPKTHVELIGACWVPHKLKAPCPNDLYEHEGECYVPVMLPPTDPQAHDK